MEEHRNPFVDSNALLNPGLLALQSARSVADQSLPSFLWGRSRRGTAPARADCLAAIPRACGAGRGGQRSLRLHGAADAFHVERSISGGIVRGPPALARDDVCGVPLRPVVLRS